jgi:hypothetical protein
LGKDFKMLLSMLCHSLFILPMPYHVDDYKKTSDHMNNDPKCF